MFAKSPKNYKEEAVLGIIIINCIGWTSVMNSKMDMNFKGENESPLHMESIKRKNVAHNVLDMILCKNRYTGCPIKNASTLTCQYLFPFQYFFQTV